MPGVDHGDASAEVDVTLAVLAPDFRILRRLGEDLRDVADAARNGGDATGLEFDGGSDSVGPSNWAAVFDGSAEQ